MVFSLISKEVSAVDYSTLNVTGGELGDMGLTEVPTNIPCHINGLFNILDNLITRIENDSFKCLSEIDALYLGNNLITYIAPGAFDSMVSLTTVGLTGNTDLAELPPHYGPNTVNMTGLYIADINLQIIPPDSYFDQMPKLQVLKTDIDLSNNFFDGWTDFRLLVYNGHLAPNFTHRTPTIEKMYLNKALSTKNMPDENVVGLTKLETAKLKYCDRLPMFEGAIALSNLDVETCQITSLPDYRHLVSLQTFNPDTSKLYCDMQSCWVFFETISNTALDSVVQNIICFGPEKLKGVNLMEIVPVQMRCYEGLYGSLFIDMYFSYCLIQRNVCWFNISLEFISQCKKSRNFLYPL